MSHPYLKFLNVFIANQLLAYLDGNGLLPSYQSGFRKNHSTETLILRLLSDLYGAMDTGLISLLALFDVSAAFDCVDHDILLQRLSMSFGLMDQPLEWLRSFLSERTNSVLFGTSRSVWVPAPFGVPQGSVLGPLLYVIYTSGIGPFAIILWCISFIFVIYSDISIAPLQVHYYSEALPTTAVTLCRS